MVGGRSRGTVTYLVIIFLFVVQFLIQHIKRNHTIKTALNLLHTNIYTVYTVPTTILFLKLYKILHSHLVTENCIITVSKCHSECPNGGSEETTISDRSFATTVSQLKMCDFSGENF